MSDIKRACQFLPFDGLSGYGTLLAETGREKEEKRLVSEDRAAVLDQMTGLLKKKDRVEVVFYDRDCYRRIEGTVEMVDRIGRKLRLEGRKIPFEDVWEIHRKERT